MSDLPPELRPEPEEMSERRRRRMWLGIGIPTLAAAVLAGLLGVPWLIVIGFCALVAAGIIFGT